MAFDIEFSPRAFENLKRLRKHDQQILIDAIAAQLTQQPDKPTRHRKKMEDNKIAPWELRVGDFRVFFDIDLKKTVVIILAIGKKSHNVLRIDGEEIDL
jgi:mRNA-degrading endonuclease RelE of RelBE toxin-antitoxin system